MAPPELAGDAPVVNVLHPLQVNLLVLLWNDANRFVALCIRSDCCNRFFGQRLNLDEPLGRKPRLHDSFAAVAVAYVIDVVLDAGQQPLLFEVGDDLLARNIAVQAGIGAAFGVDAALRVHHVDRRQMMALAEGKVVGVVRRSYLHRAGAKVAADPLVENDRNLAADQRQTQSLAVQVQIALVFRMNSNSYVAQHRFRTRGCNRQKLASIFPSVTYNWVTYLP